MIVLLAISMAACLTGGILKKQLMATMGDSIAQYHLFNAVTSLTAMVALLCVSNIQRISVFTVGLGLVFGLVTALQQIANLKALDVGPFSYTTVIMSLSTLIPALSGAIFWNETIVPVQILGIILMVGCFVLSVDMKQSEKKTSQKWLLYCLAAFFCTGGIGVMQKWHQSTHYKNELDLFLVVAFAFSTLYSAVMYLRYRKQAPVSSGCKKITWLPILLFLVNGLCVAICNKLNLYLSGVMDSAVFYPLVNGGNLILTTAAAYLLFRERLTPLRWVGLVLGTISVILLCNPFG